MDAQYKAAKVASVSLLEGGGIWEINYVTFTAPAAALLWSVLQVRQAFFKPYTVPAAVTDFMLNCCVILFATTIYSSAPQVLNGMLFLPTIATLLKGSSASAQPPKPTAPREANGKPAEAEDEPEVDDRDPLPLKPFITTYRGAMVIITCTSILAVDFPVFPRRFAKTESFGTSLMDVGVGSFVFAAGIVAARQQLKEAVAGTSSIFVRLREAMRHSLPLVVLGLVRFWSVKGLEYPEHVSEYGVHWNFFFTLALLPPSIALLQPILRFAPAYGLVALVISIAYETFLTPDMKSWIILSERDPNDWLSQNREGVFSMVGYLAIFIAGMGIGTGILPRDPDPDAAPRPPAAPEKDPLDEDADWLEAVLTGKDQEAKPLEERDSPFKLEIPKTTFFFLAKWAIIWFLLAGWAMWNYGPRLTPSRRLANLSYVTWVAAFNTAQLFLFCAVEAFMFPDLYKAKDRQTERTQLDYATSRIMKAFNRNGLAIFLFANLLTGSINMSVKTLYMDDVPAMVVLVAYTAVLTGTALLLDHYDISIKL